MVVQPRKMRRRSHSLAEQLQTLINSPEQKINNTNSNMPKDDVENGEYRDELHYEIEEDENENAEHIQDQIEQIGQTEMDDCDEETVLYEILDAI